MKEIELKLISELMKDSRRSDRELARELGSSQATISRIRRKLEEKGYIREYTIIPDFSKLGYAIFALTLAKLKKLSPEELEKSRKTTLERIKNAPSEIVLLERGIGTDFDRVIISFHKDYTSYLKLKEITRSYPYVEKCGSFLIDLNDKVHYRSLTFSTLANHILESKEKE